MDGSVVSKPFCHSLNLHYLHYVIFFSFGLYIYILREGTSNNQMTMAHFLSKESCGIHMACPQQMSSCELLVGFHGRELILEESFLGVHLVSFSYLRYGHHIVGSFLIYFLWIEHCSSKLGGFLSQGECTHQLLERWLIEVGLAFWQALKNVDHRKNPSPKVSLSKNSSPTIT